MQRVQRNSRTLEPVGNFQNVLLAVGVVEMLARRENLNCLCAALHQPVEQAGMQPLFDHHKR